MNILRILCGATLLCLILSFFIGLIALQIFLSKRESKWPGLLLPILTFAFSLSLPLWVFFTPGIVSSTVHTEALLFCVVANLPTIVFLAIYFVCRKKQRWNKQLNKMSIQDLN